METKTDRMIEARDISKRFGRLTAVGPFSFRLERGDAVALVGPSGAGKSTLLRLLAGYFMPTTGTVSVGGCDTSSDSLGARRTVGYLPEDDPVYPEMRVGEYLHFRARLKGLSGRPRSKRMHELVLRCGLGGLERVAMVHLSKGETRRVLLADALLADPAVVLLDEPTLGLDPDTAERVRALIARSAGDRTLLFSTHDMAEAERLASRLMVLVQGRLAAFDTIASLKAAAGGASLGEVVARLTRAGEAA
jgi:ABC-2 type transport system ATP-binding protein